MTSNTDTRQTLERIAEAVVSSTPDDYSRMSVHLGHEYGDTADPEAERIRQRGGNLQWVAFGFDPHEMWDVHVGVLIENTTATIGFHVHERISERKPQDVVDIATDTDLEYRYSDVATEHQFNRPPVSLAETDTDELAEDVVEVYTEFEPIVDGLIDS